MTPRITSMVTGAIMETALVWVTPVSNKSLIRWWPRVVSVASPLEALTSRISEKVCVALPLNAAVCFCRRLDNFRMMTPIGHIMRPMTGTPRIRIMVMRQSIISRITIEVIIVRIPLIMEGNWSEINVFKTTVSLIKRLTISTTWCSSKNGTWSRSNLSHTDFRKLATTCSPAYPSK